MIFSRKSILLAAILIINVLLFFYLYYSIPRIGFVRNKILIENYDGIKESRIVYNKKLKEWKHKIDTMNIVLQKEAQKFENEQSHMTSAIRVFREHQLSEHLEVFEKFKYNIEEKAKVEEEKISQAAYNQINSMVEEYAKEHHYDIILGTTREGNVMYGSEAKDITQEVLNSLNKKYKGE